MTLRLRTRGPARLLARGVVLEDLCLTDAAELEAQLRRLVVAASGATAGRRRSRERESRRMQHCVQTFARRALNGRCRVFHADTRVGAGATVLLVPRRRGGLAIDQAKGQRNRALTPPEVDALHLWVADLEAMQASRITGAPPTLWGRFEARERATAAETGGPVGATPDLRPAP